MQTKESVIGHHFGIRSMGCRNQSSLNNNDTILFLGLAQSSDILGQKSIEL